MPWHALWTCLRLFKSRNLTFSNAQFPGSYGVWEKNADYDSSLTFAVTVENVVIDL